MADEINKAPLRVVAGGGEINHADSATNSPQTENRRRIHLAAHATAVAPKTSVSHGNNKRNHSPKERPNGWRARLAAMFPALPPVKRSGERSIFFYMFKCLFLRYFSVRGRASRKEFWGFVLLTVMAEMLVGLLSVFYAKRGLFAPGLLAQCHIHRYPGADGGGNYPAGA